MKRFTAMCCVPLLAAACGSSPVAPTPTPPSGPRGTSLQMMYTGPDSVRGWAPPTSLTLRANDGAAPVSIQSATFRMLDEQGRVLASATAAVGEPLVEGVYISGDVVVQTLSWPLDQGYGKRIDGSLTFRSVSGEVKTIPISIPAR